MTCGCMHTETERDTRRGPSVLYDGTGRVLGRFRSRQKALRVGRRYVAKTGKYARVETPTPKGRRPTERVHTVRRMRDPMKRMGRRNARDPKSMSDEAHELVLFGVNDGDLYRQSAQPIMQNLAKKLKKGTFDPEMAVKLWQYHAERAARAYGKEHLTGAAEALRVFPPAVRREAAREFARYYMDEIRDKAGVTSHDRDARRRRARARRRLLAPNMPRGRRRLARKAHRR